MNLSEIETSPDTTVDADCLNWEEVKGEVYRCDFRFQGESHGIISAYCASLPGVVSEGDSKDAALSNITAAFRLAVEAYHDLNKPIPWVAEPDAPLPDETQKCICVNVD